MSAGAVRFDVVGDHQWVIRFQRHVSINQPSFGETVVWRDPKGSGHKFASAWRIRDLARQRTMSDMHVVGISQGTFTA